MHRHRHTYTLIGSTFYFSCSFSQSKTFEILVCLSVFVLCCVPYISLLCHFVLIRILLLNNEEFRGSAHTHTHTHTETDQNLNTIIMYINLFLSRFHYYCAHVLHPSFLPLFFRSIFFVYVCVWLPNKCVCMPMHTTSTSNDRARLSNFWRSLFNYDTVIFKTANCVRKRAKKKNCITSN